MIKGKSISLNNFILYTSVLFLAHSPLYAAWSLQTIDTGTNLGWYTSIAVDSNNNPHISYYDGTNQDLKYAYWNGVAWSTSTIDSTGDVGKYASIAIGSDDVVHVAYRDQTNTNLKYAWKQGSTWQVETADSAGNIGEYCSITVDSSNKPHVAYTDSSVSSSRKLKYAHKTTGSWQTGVVDSTTVPNGTGWHTSIKLDNTDIPHFAYYQITENNLLYAKITGGTTTTMVVDAAVSVGYYTSLELDANSRPRISYYNIDESELGYASFNGTVWSTQTVDSDGIVGYYTSLELDAGGNQNIAYHDFANGDLKYAAWTGTSWNIETIDAQSDSGKYCSLIFDALRNKHISYYQAGSLKYAYEASGLSPVSVDTVSPDSGSQGETLSITITGAGFADGAALFFSGEGITADSLTVNSATEIQAQITIAANASTGSRVVTVKVSGLNGVKTEAFTVLAADNSGDLNRPPDDVEQDLINNASAQIKVRGGEKGYINTSKQEQATIIFKASQAGSIELKVYTMRGLLIWEKNKQTDGAGDFIRWNGTNKDGSFVASGVYVVHVKGPGLDTTAKVAVVR